MIGGSYKFTEAKVRRLLGQSTRAEKARERHSNARGTETESYSVAQVGLEFMAIHLRKPPKCLYSRYELHTFAIGFNYSA